MSKSKKILVFIFTIFIYMMKSVSVSEAYKSISFSPSIDFEKHRVIFEKKEESRDNLAGQEDKYIDEAERFMGAVISRRGNPRLGSSEYQSLLDPKSGDGEEYAAANWRENSAQWARKDIDVELNDKTSATKLFTFPPAALYTDPAKKNVMSISGHRSKVIIGAVAGTNRDNQKLSMQEGFNLILSEIEALMDGYSSREVFLNVVKGVAWILRPEGYGDVKGRTVKFAPYNTAPVKDNETNNETNDEPNDEPNDVSEDKLVTVSAQVFNNVAKVTISKGDSEPIQISTLYRVSTGFTASSTESVRYSPNEEETVTLYGEEGYYSDYTGDSLSYINLYDLIVYALIKYDAHGASVIQESGITSTVAGILDNIATGLESGLGLLPIEDLVFNRHTVGDEKAYENDRLASLGVYPAGWHNIVSLMYRPSIAIAVAFLGFAILKAIMALNIESMNVDARISAKKSVSNIIVAIVGLLLFKTIFSIMAILNYIIVDFIYAVLDGESLSIYDVFASSVSGTLGKGSIAVIFMRYVYLGIVGYINIMYITRAINVAMMLGLHPIFMVIGAFEGFDRIKDFLFELATNLFMQVFHAIVLMFITLAASYMGESAMLSSPVFTNVVLLWLIVPISGAYREMVLGKKSGSMAAGAMIATQGSKGVKKLATGSIGMATSAGKSAGKAIGKFNNVKRGYQKSKLNSKGVGSAKDQLENIKNNKESFESMSSQDLEKQSKDMKKRRKIDRYDNIKKGNWDKVFDDIERGKNINKDMKNIGEKVKGREKVEKEIIDKNAKGLEGVEGIKSLQGNITDKGDMINSIVNMDALKNLNPEGSQQSVFKSEALNAVSWLKDNFPDKQEFDDSIRGQFLQQFPDTMVRDLKSLGKGDYQMISDVEKFRKLTKPM